MANRVVDNLEENRYEAYVGDDLAGILEYGLTADAIVLMHSETDPAFKGQGVAGDLARFALEDARARGLGVIVRCPFVASYLRRHPGYADLVVG